MIPVYEPFLGVRVRQYVLDCVESGWVSSLGQYVPRFEAEFSRFCGVPYGIATSNGTTALHLALAVLGIKPGDEVIVPALTFVATANAVAYTGASVVLADVDPATWTLDPESVRQLITPRTRAIIPVHLYGHPCDMDPIVALARRHGLRVVEDAAEAHGARYRGRPVGSLGDLGCFSFYGNKIITTGEGGMVVTANREWAERAAFLRDHAMVKAPHYYHPEIGFNYRMTNVQAAIGCAQMEEIATVLERKRAIAAAYCAGLCPIPGLTLAPQADWAESVFWMYSVLVEPSFGKEREAVCEGLRAAGIDTRPFFVPLHELPPYRRADPLPIASRLGATGINLPSGPALTSEQVEFICRSLAALRGPA